MNADLLERIKEVNDAVAELAPLETSWKERGRAYYKACLQVGALLIQIQARTPRGQYRALFGPRINLTYSASRTYLRLAINAEKVKDAPSMIQALRMITNKGGTPGPPTAKKWPGPIEGLRRAAMLSKSCQAFPLPTWTPEQLERLREYLQPIAATLWPEIKNSTAQRADSMT